MANRLGTGRGIRKDAYPKTKSAEKAYPKSKSGKSNEIHYAAIFAANEHRRPSVYA